MTARGDRRRRRRGTTSTVPTRRRASRRRGCAAIAAHSAGGRDARPGVVAHHREPDRAVADERGEVGRRARGVDRVAVARVVGPRPRHAVVEEVARDVLDVGEQVGDVARGSLGDAGYSDRLQLPTSIVVTPCSGSGSRVGSQNTCGSVWAWVSMKPGATTAPPASKIVLAVGPQVRAPTSTMRPARTRTSARRRGAPVPSTTSPPRMSKVAGVIEPLLRSNLPWCPSWAP